jgi:thiol:disulfide interchange protein DsbD
LAFVVCLTVVCLTLTSMAAASLAAAGVLSSTDGEASGGMSWTDTPSIELPSLPAEAFALSVVEGDRAQLRARLLVSSGPSPRVGVLFDLAPGWHLYWRNPGGTGIAPSLGLSADGYTIGEMAWPSPQTFAEADGLFTTYGYEGSVLLSAPLIPDTGASEAVGRRLLRAEASVLVCRTQCVPASISLSSPLDTGLTGAEQRLVDDRMAEALARVPASADALGWVARARWTGATPAIDEAATVELVIEGCASAGDGCPHFEPAAGAFFLPFEGETFEFGDARLLMGDEATGRSTLSLPVDRLDTGDDRLRGLIPIRSDGNGIRHVSLDVPIEPAATATTPPAAPAEGAGSPLQWLTVFGLALLGGLVLNGMPCVLPVLAIKVVSIADLSDKQPGEVRLHGLAYTGGVLGSMALLAAIVVSLRAAGHSVGWGFQFQEPLFVAAISAVLVTFALNLFGLFEIDLGQGRLATIGQQSTGLRRSAFEGLLAVVLATPCTAPFLGTAVGFAFASSGFGIAAIFLAIGLGLASPFLLVSFFPGLARFVPRSGPWMNTLRAGLGFCLLATVVWLLWILGQRGGANAVVATTGVLLFLSFMLWGFGLMQPLRSAWLGRTGALTIALLAFTGFNLIGIDRMESTPTDAGTDASPDHWLSYSESAVRDAVSNGRPAFVVFTADWCITCQVNERTVIEREAIQDAFAEGDVALFKADWTRRDDAIRRKLAEFGRAGVPLYLVYRPHAPDSPQVLSELLTRGEILSALAEATGGNRAS